MPTTTFISKAELCEILGVSLPTIDRRLRDGTLHATRLGRRVLIPASEIDRLIASASDNSSEAR